MSKDTAMKLKKIPFISRKTPFKLALLILTFGASIILGFLSFSGMYAFLPALPLAFATFALSVAYEGEIYLQNIKGALKKLFKNNYLEHHFAKEFLLTHFPKNTKDEDCPQFFRDYKAQLKLLRSFDHKELKSASKKRKKQIEKTLSDMEKWFASHLFPAKNKADAEQSEYTKKLHQWLAKNAQQEWQERLEKRRFHFNLVKILSLAAALFMGLGSTYLIVEAFSVIPIFATIPFALWPVIILPMALVAGAAYGFLTYNAITDMINNDTIRKWYQKLRDDLSQGLTWRNALMTTTALFLVGLTITLTIFTAGTWWTVAKQARPLFAWMKKIPIGIINPIMVGIPTLFFNIQNTAESLEMIDKASRSKKSFFRTIYESITNGWAHLRQTENWLQIINPFRIFLKLTVTPLRILFFLGHLVSIALTSDRMPGVPQIISILIAIISEGFEDAHYFIGTEHKHHHKFKSLLKEHLSEEAGHSHAQDIPTRFLKAIASPIYFLATLWDYYTSKLNRIDEQQEQLLSETERKNLPPVLTFKEAWRKQNGLPKKEHVPLNSNDKLPSANWQKEHAIAQIEKFQKKHLDKAEVGQQCAEEKINTLNQLKNKIRNADHNSLQNIVQQAQNEPVYNQHRWFIQNDEKTRTQEFVENLPRRVNLST